MSAFDYLESRADADELITDFGASVSVRRTNNGGSKPYEPTQTTSEYATVAALIDYADSVIDGKNILRSDRRALVAAGPLYVLGITDIKADADALVIDGVPIRIVNVNTLKPAATVVLFDCQLRF